MLIVYDELLTSLAFALVHPTSLHAASLRPHRRLTIVRR